MRNTPPLTALTALAALAVVVTLGCDVESWDPDPQPGQIDNAAAASDVRLVMATVNDEPIYMEDLHEILVTNYGMTMAQQLIANEVVEQEARRLGVTVNDDDIRAEDDYFIQRITGQSDVAPSHRRELLARMLAQQGMSHADYQRVLRREALLRKIVAPQVQPTDAEVHDEYDRQFGRQVQVRHIQVESLARAEQILEMARDGVDFARLAQQYSLSPSAQQGGLMPPIGLMSKEWPPAIRDVAISLRQVGELSGIIRTGTAFHVLRLERDIPPQDIEFDQVADALLMSLRRRIIDENAKPALLRHLLAQANVVFVDRLLRTQHARTGAQP